MTQNTCLRTLDLVYIALFSVLMAVCAWITIPFAVPFTLQTFALFLTLTTLGGWRGLYVITLYLLMGAAGLPVFSGFQGGVGVLLGSGGGYLLGFFLAALVYRLFTGTQGASQRTTQLACVAGLLVCYLCGTLWFRFLYAGNLRTAGILTLLLSCVLPFLVPDILKLVLALWLSPRIRKHLK